MKKLFRTPKLTDVAISVTSVARGLYSFAALNEGVGGSAFGELESALLAIVFRVAVLVLADFAFHEKVRGWTRGLAFSGCLVIAMASGPFATDRRVLVSPSSPILLDALIVGFVGIRRWQQRPGEEAGKFGRTLFRSGQPFYLIDMLSAYSYEQFGSLFLSIPQPRRRQDQQAEAWLNFLHGENVIRRHWRKPIERAPQFLRDSHPDLFHSGVRQFDVYRLDREALQSLIERLDRPAEAQGAMPTQRRRAATPNNSGEWGARR